MGSWFLATAFSNFLAGRIAGLTGVSSDEGAEPVIPPPSDTVHVYGDVFGKIAIVAVASAVVCFALVPLLKRWMHPGVDQTEDEREPGARVAEVG
jgi:POT family proton-dependent oligopeptide transporter